MTPPPPMSLPEALARVERLIARLLQDRDNWLIKLHAAEAIRTDEEWEVKFLASRVASSAQDAQAVTTLRDALPTRQQLVFALQRISDGTESCPGCGAWSPGTHRPSCWLARLLAAYGDEPMP